MKNPFNFSSKKKKEYKPENTVKGEKKPENVVKNQIANTTESKAKGTQIEETVVVDISNTKVQNNTPNIPPKPEIGKVNIPAKNKDLKANNIKPEPYIFKPKIIEKKLTIILIEDTEEMSNYNDTIFKLCSKYKSSDLITIIRYGKEVDKKDFELLKYDMEKHFKCINETGKEICFYDCLIEVSKIVSETFKRVKEKDHQITKVTEVEIVGVGTCKDNNSKASREDAIKSFCKMLKDTKATTKYLGLTENSFLDAAEFGFRSIIAISRSY